MRMFNAKVAVAVSVSLAGLTLVAPARATTPGSNGLILFSADVGTGYQIYTVRPDGTDLTQITHVDGDAINGDWSPNGQRIAFEIDTPDTSVVALMNADGSHLVELPKPAGDFAGDPAFTANGRSLIDSEFDPVTSVNALFSMNLLGGDRRFITTGGESGVNGGGVADPNVSPNGRTISFLGIRGEVETALKTVDLNGSHLRQLTSYDLNVAFKHDWAPDGRHLVLTDNADNLANAANIAVIRPDGTGLHYLTHFTDPADRAYVGSYSPDGRSIVFRLEDHGQFGLFTMPPDGGTPRQVLALSDFKPRFIDWGSRPEDSQGQDGQ
jgi:Tol biopolymer transport system component